MGERLVSLSQQPQRDMAMCRTTFQAGTEAYASKVRPRLVSIVPLRSVRASRITEDSNTAFRGERRDGEAHGEVGLWAAEPRDQ